MRVLVIGGTNFIGPALVHKLIELGHELTVFHRGQTTADMPPGTKQIFGDRDRLGEFASELRAFAPRVVVHMIAYVEEHARSLIDVFRGIARRLVVVSSGDVYKAYGLFHGTESGPIEPLPLAEDAPLRSVLFPYRSQAQGPEDLKYRYDKIPVERAVMGDSDMRGTILRLPMVYGPGDKGHRLFPYLKRMDDSRPAIVLEEGMAEWRCPRGYVENVAAAIALCVTDERAAGRIYNVSEAPAFSEAEWVRKIGEAVGWRGEVVIVPRRRTPEHYRPEQHIETDSTRIRSELGYRESVPFTEALKRTILWERANPPDRPQVDYAE